MKKEPIEAEVRILKRIAELHSSKGVKQWDAYAPLIGECGKDTFLWHCVQNLVAEKYLSREKLGNRVYLKLTKKGRRFLEAQANGGIL